MISEDLVGLLRKKYEDSRKYIVLEQVADGTGFDRIRTIDAVVFSLWPSDGLTRAAFEIKVSRSDFIRELQIPNKHKWCRECFHEFWFVAPKEVIQLDEIPGGVGWMCPRGDKLVIKKLCQRNPTPRLDDSLLAAFMRAAGKEIKRDTDKLKKEILKTDPTHLDALSYRKAVVSFLQSRGVQGRMFDATEESIRGMLEQATLDRQLVQDRDQIIEKLSQFQRRMQELFTIFALVANKSLIERNKLGEYIVTKYGGHDREALKSLKDTSKEKGYVGTKEYTDIIEAILNWNQNKQEVTQ